MSDRPTVPPGIDWRRADLRNMNFAGISLEGSDMRATDVSGSNFTGANLRNVDFRGATMIGTTFQDANLNGAKMQGVLALKADFRGADMRQADMRGAYLDKAMMTQEMVATPADLEDRPSQAGNQEGRIEELKPNADLRAELDAAAAGAKALIKEPAQDVGREELGQLETQDPPRQGPRHKP
jgi:uncharacterized protein YjbI with pentapeptide repeats